MHPMLSMRRYPCWREKHGHTGSEQAGKEKQSIDRAPVGYRGRESGTVQGLRSAGVRKAELARRMGTLKQQVERLLDLDHASRIEQLEASFAALRIRLTIDIQHAA
jgi:hypothetical protein